MHLSLRRLMPIAALSCALLVGPALAGDEAFESAPARSASEILGAEGIKGPGYTVKENVVIREYLDHFEVESKFGLYKPNSRRMLKMRTHEIETMQRLLQMGETNAYMKALEGKLVSLPTSLVKVATDPVSALENVPKGVSKTFGRVSSFFSSSSKGGVKLSPEELRKDLVASEKRKLAAELMVDVYSTNSKLQELLESVATARYAGEFTVSLASYAIPGGAGSVLYSTASYNTQLKSLLTDKTETELNAHNRQVLTKQGVQPYVIGKFMESSHLSPRHQSVISTALTALGGVHGRQAVIEAALEAVDETRALFQEQQAVALARYHRKVEPLARMHAIGGIVLAQTRSKQFLICAPVDTLFWDAGGRHLLNLLSKAPLARSATKRTLQVKGRVTERLVEEAKAAGFEVVSGWPWMPAKVR
jgi:hypothetical protein